MLVAIKNKPGSRGPEVLDSPEHPEHYLLIEFIEPITSVNARADKGVRHRRGSSLSGGLGIVLQRLVCCRSASFDLDLDSLLDAELSESEL